MGTWKWTVSLQGRENPQDAQGFGLVSDCLFTQLEHVIPQQQNKMQPHRRNHREAQLNRLVTEGWSKALESFQGCKVRMALATHPR